MGFSTHDPYDAEWEHRDTGRTASFSRDDCDETCQGTDDCDCAEMNAQSLSTERGPLGLPSPAEYRQQSERLFSQIRGDRSSFVVAFKVDGRGQRWIRFGKDITSVRASALESIRREWPTAKISSLSVRAGG
jgi:hypothetical protein